MKREDVEGLVAVFVFPAFLVWPILWALSRWRLWEVCAWLAVVAVGAYCWIRQRDRERSGRE